MFGVFTAHARFRTVLEPVLAAATHQPSHDSVLYFREISVTQQYSLVATTHGALRATSWRASFWSNTAAVFKYASLRLFQIKTTL
jgi:hypothetical protein